MTKEINDLNEAIKKLKFEMWKERYSFLKLTVFIYAFLAGAAIEHYFPELTSILWYR